MSNARMSIRSFVPQALAAIGVAAAAADGASAADARSRYAADQRYMAYGSAFDGRWSVVIETERGACDRSYRFGIDVVNGAVTYDGSPYGRVTPKGAVRISLSMGDQHAEGGGRLSLTSGRGAWRGFGSAGACSGHWVAERRD